MKAWVLFGGCLRNSRHGKEGKRERETKRERSKRGFILTSLKRDETGRKREIFNERRYETQKGEQMLWIFCGSYNL